MASASESCRVPSSTCYALSDARCDAEAFADSVSADILYVIIENSPTALVLTWRRTCRAFFRAAAATLRLRYEKVVRPFVTSIPALDELLRRHGAIISGSVALQFFLYHETWEPADMDIYVSTHKFKDFIDDAISTDGLNFKPDGSLIPSGVSAQPRRWPIREIRRFVTQTNRRVDVVRSTTGTAVTPLNGFWSTLMQNFITPDGAACGYPDATLERRGVISQDHYQTDSIRSAIIKYEARGYTLVQDEWRVEFQPSYIRHQHYFGDRNAVVVDFRRAPYDPQPSLPIHPTRRSWFPTRPYPPRRVSGGPIR